MIKLKLLLIESIFDDAFKKWKNETNEDVVKRYIDFFKLLKSKNFIKGQKSDISHWIKTSFIEFKNFIDKEEKEYEYINIMKSSEKAVDKVFENDVVLVIIPKTPEAASKYGRNTKWCISGGEVEENWYSYTDRGIKFYFILPKQSEHGSGKIAISVYPNGKTKEAFDETDRRINGTELKNVLRKYKIPNRGFFKNEYDWDGWLKRQKYRIRPDGKIDIDGNVILSGMKFTELPPINFGNINGHFDFSNNMITSLGSGFPKNVNGSVSLTSRNLTEKQVRQVCNVKGDVDINRRFYDPNEEGGGGG